MAVEPHPRIDDLLASLFDMYGHRHALGTMTCSVYDTAWVANVTKTVSGVPQYLFPSSFLFVLDAQLPDGSWNAHYYPEDASQSFPASSDASSNLSDSVLSTMAALYTVNFHAMSPHQIDPAHLPAPSLSTRIVRAAASLQNMLRIWRTDTCNAVGFEILAPALLDLLATQGHTFDFPDLTTVLTIRAAKMQRIRPAMLYAIGPAALLHSLEAFHIWDTEEFDVRKVKHHMVRGSMMASPAATASYLMKTPEWDDEAEAYLQLVIECGDGKGRGGVPSAWPSTNFEMIWVISTLLEAGLWAENDSGGRRELISEIIDDARKTSGGLVGFTPGIEPDLDDSAKASIILSLSGKLGFSKAIVENFDAPKCLKTYRAERDPSISANCNALLSIILDKEDYPSKSATIEKITNFICDTWRDTQGSINDKWNLSSHYPTMLMTRSLTELLRIWNTGELFQIVSSLLTKKVVPVLLKILVRTLQSQQSDGSWGCVGPREETAYAILTLASLLSLPLAQSVHSETLSALQRGRNILSSMEGRKPEYLWIEKVTYGSRYLAETYVAAAILISVDKSIQYGVKAFCNLKLCKEKTLELHSDKYKVEEVAALENGTMIN